MAEYFGSDFQHAYSEEELRSSDPATQREMMEAWFRRHYEDPAEHTPYESAEGGYLWVAGGPYDAGCELEQQFSAFIPQSVIDGLAEELAGECPGWARTLDTADFDAFVIDDIARITEYCHNFAGAILDIERLIKIGTDFTVQECFRRLLYVNVITALETYLSDAFINTIANRPELIRRLIETTPEFQSKKVLLSEIFAEMDGIEDKARKYIGEMVWHRLAKAKAMYFQTLGVEFPSDCALIFRAILTRHDIVHRNGRTRDGQEIVVSPTMLAELIQTVERFVQHIDAQMADVRNDKPLGVARQTAASSAYAPASRLREDSETSS